MAEQQVSYIVISTILGISGWAKLAYDYIVSKPKIAGRVFNIITGSMPHPNIPNKQLTTFLVYLYLTNKRKSPIHILDYEMEIDAGKGYKHVDRVFGINNTNNWTFTDTQGQLLEIPNFQDKLIYKSARPVEYGQPLHGFVFFAGDASYYGLSREKYKITCRDVFGNKHKIVYKPKESENLFLLQDIAGIRMPT
jgi:hypothetical protein